MSWKEKDVKGGACRGRENSAPVGNMIEGAQPFPNKVPGF